MQRSFLPAPWRYRHRMVDDPDIWRAANLMVKRHGDGAAAMAAKRAEELAARGYVQTL